MQNGHKLLTLCQFLLKTCARCVTVLRLEVPVDCPMEPFYNERGRNKATIPGGLLTLMDKSDRAEFLALMRQALRRGHRTSPAV